MKRDKAKNLNFRESYGSAALSMHEIKEMLGFMPKEKIQEVIDTISKKMYPKPTREQAVEAVRTLIAYIGEDPERSGLKKTPERVIKAFETDWAIGYDKKFIQEQTLSILGAEFDDGAENYDQLICVREVPFFSLCEHHLAEISGVATVAYIPSKTKGKILGLSKLPRIVNMFARRLQVQERLTNQIADFLQIHCKPQGVGVVIKARHACMESRGIKCFGTDTITSALRGDFLSDPTVRNEFLSLVRK